MTTTLDGAAKQTPFGREQRELDGKRVINYWKMVTSDSSRWTIRRPTPTHTR